MSSIPKPYDKTKTNIAHIVRNWLRIALRRLVDRLPPSVGGEIYSVSLRKYDRRAGTYVADYQRSFDPAMMVNGVVSGVHKRVPFGEPYHAHLDWVANDVLRPLLTPHSSILEVGAGELTTLAPIVQRLADPTLKVHASELSWSRCIVGREFSRSLDVPLASLTCASVTHLPYKTSSIDVVFTNGCLEELAGYETQAVAELARVARRYLIIMEASYELGLPAQRRKLRNRQWNLGLMKAVKLSGLNLLRHELVPHSSDVYSRSAIFLLEKTPDADGDIIISSPLACPFCKSAVHTDDVVFFCEPCGLAFPILDGVPIFTPGNAVVASLYPRRHRMVTPGT